MGQDWRIGGARAGDSVADDGGEVADDHGAVLVAVPREGGRRRVDQLQDGVPETRLPVRSSTGCLQRLQQAVSCELKEQSVLLGEILRNARF